MQYRHVPPRAERHEVNWYRMDRPGIYAAERPFFSSLVLHPDLVTWLDANAPGWSFSSDWDYSNAGDDDEGCHLLVSSSEQAHGFVAMANAMSRTWIEADRANMRYSLVLEVPGEEPVEIERSHRIPNGMDNERTLQRHLVLDRQPMRARIYRSMREAWLKLHDQGTDAKEPTRIDVDLEADDVIVPGTRVAYLRTEAVAA